MNAARPLAVCVALAMGAHAALLARNAPSAGPHSEPGGHQSMTVRVQQADEPAAPVPVQAPEAPIASVAPDTPPPAAPMAAQAPSSQETAPSFDGGPPGVSFPDAPLPEGGADVRAYLVLDEHGTTQSVSTAVAPGVPQGFQKMAELTLRQARLNAAAGARYCLLVRFEPDAREGRLAWLPGAAQDAARCLVGALPAPREIESEPAP